MPNTYTKTQQIARTEARAESGFVDVRRALLAEGSLCLRDAAVLCHVHWRAARRHTVTGPEIAALMECDRRTGDRALKRLQARGWLDERRRPSKPLPVGKEGFLRVPWALFHEHGVTDSFVLVQLRSMYALKAGRTEDYRLLALPGLLASLLGSCADTMRDVLARLELGDTTRQRLEDRRERRKGVARLRAYAPLISRELEADSRMTFRFVCERAREALKATTRPQAQQAFAVSLDADQQQRLVDGAELIMRQLKPPKPGVVGIPQFLPGTNNTL